MKSQARVALRTTGLLILLLFLQWGRRNSATAQSSTIRWSRPVNLSNTPQPSAHPAIVTDDYGYIHVFWSEEVGAEPMRPGEDTHGTGNTIFYVRWDGTTWTSPIDVLLVPGEILAEFPAVGIDADNKLHLVWTATTRLYYSSAPSWLADSAHNWSEPIVLADYSVAARPYGASVATDPSGGVHVIYAANGNGAGVYYLRSTDGGTTWQPPITLSEPLAPLEEGFSTVRIVSVDSGCLHTVWQTNSFEGFGQAIYYAHTTGNSDDWSRPVQLAYRDSEDFEVGWPYLTAIGKSELHLIYVDGAVIGSRGRYHRISTDGGATWSAPHHIITDMMGINGYVQPVVDGAGQMHLVINMRTAVGQIVGIYYARWHGTGWSPVEPVDIFSPGAPSAHHMAAALGRGNELHVAYTQHRGGEIWCVYGVIPSVNPYLALALPSPQAPTPSVEVTEAVLQMPTQLPGTMTQPISENAPPPLSPATALPLASAVGMVFLLVMAVVGWTWIRSR